MKNRQQTKENLFQKNCYYDKVEKGNLDWSGMKMYLCIRRDSGPLGQKNWTICYEDLELATFVKSGYDCFEMTGLKKISTVELTVLEE